MKRVSLILCLVLLSALSAMAETARPQWFTIGGGGGNSGLAWGAEYSYLIPRLVFSFRFISTHRTTGIFLDNGGRDFGLLAGVYATDAEGEHFSISVGFGVADAVIKEERINALNTLTTTYTSASAGALLLQAQGYGAGHLGLLVYADINSKASFVGGLVAWRFGKLR